MGQREHTLRNRLDWIDQILAVCGPELIEDVLEEWESIYSQIPRLCQFNALTSF